MASSIVNEAVCNAGLRLPPMPSVRDVIKLYNINAIKKLSQNFLLSEKITDRLARISNVTEKCHVCEVGPGPGSITRSILKLNPEKVYLIEKDKRFAGPLRLLNNAVPNKLQVYWGDVLSFNMKNMFPAECKVSWAEQKLPDIRIIGNLPFSVSTPLIIRWLKNISNQSNAWEYGRVPLNLTFQCEVAERLKSDVLDEQRSRLSIMAQYLCHVDFKFTIPGCFSSFFFGITGKSFVPKPDVDVGVVKFVPRIEPLIQQPFDLVEKLVRQTFSMRQKFCSRGISTLFPLAVRQKLTEQFFSLAEVNPETRPYELSIEEFSRMCDAYAKICDEFPSILNYNYRGIKPDEAWDEANRANLDTYSKSHDGDTDIFNHNSNRLISINKV